VRKVFEGYLYLIPYLGDDIAVYPEKIEGDAEELVRKHGEALDLLMELSRFEGKRVVVVIEDNKVTIEAMD